MAENGEHWLLSAAMVALHNEAGFRLLPSPPLQGCPIRWPVFCLREDDGNLLPSDLPGAPAAEALVRIRRDDGGSRACRISPLLALSP